MSSFTQPLVVSPLEDGRNWKLIKEFSYYVDRKDGEVIKVPAGFITDFASVPRLFWNIFPPYGRWGKAAVVHDWCYKTQLYPRKKCDRVFLQGMKVLGVCWWRRKVMYRAVRLFGAKAYRKGHKDPNITLFTQ